MHIDWIINNSALIRQLVHYTNKALKDKGIKVFITTFLYLCSLFFCGSNVQLFIHSLIYCTVLFYVFRSVRVSVFFGLIVTYAFTKGKVISFLLLPLEFVQMQVTRDIMLHVSVTISDFFLFLLCWIMAREYISKRLVFHFSLQEVSLGGLFLISLISATISIHTDVSTLMALQIAKLLLVLYGMKNFVTDEWKRLSLMGISALVFFEGLWVLLQFFNHGPLGKYIESVNTFFNYGKPAWENVDLMRFSGTFVDPDILGTFLFMHAVLFISILLVKRERNRYERIVFSLSASAAVIALFLTGNRILYVLLIASLVFLVSVTRGWKRVILLLRNKYFLYSIFISLLIIFPYVVVRMQRLSEVFSDEGSGTFRLQMLTYASKLGLQNIFGVGLGMSPYAFALQFSGEKIIFGPDYPHNIFSQVLAELGLPGLAAMIFFCYITFRPLFLQGIRLKNSHYLLAALAYLASAQFYPIFLPLPEMIGYFMIYLGLSQYSDS